MPFCPGPDLFPLRIVSEGNSIVLLFIIYYYHLNVVGLARRIEF